ncbi:MAG: lipocalin [Rhizobiales bacterium PAR1]|nr:MAG: lipocalin [Rhizobiales bacterium PAR1]
MPASPFPVVAIIGILIGVLIGFFVRRARLCSFGAIESALAGGDWRRMKIFALALGIALGGTQILIAGGWLDPTKTTYVASRIPWLSIVIGALIFGLGMALVGTCAFGSLVRLGGGDLRSLVVLMVFGAVAYAVLRGSLSGLRIQFFEQWTLPAPGDGPSALNAWLKSVWGAGLALSLMLTAAATLILPTLLDRRLWKAPRLVTAGVVLGLGVIGGWLATGVFVDEFATNLRVQSLTFVAPVARTLFGVMIGGPEWFDFGVGTVIGVVAGAYAAARLADDFRWEAFDDAREMGRHLFGAAMMGLGGILAGGCTIGQSLTAGSLTAMSWPISSVGILLGARIGIVILVEGSLGEAIKSRVFRT